MKHSIFFVLVVSLLTACSTRRIWDEIQSLCETRDGHGGGEGGEVQILVPTVP